MKNKKLVKWIFPLIALGLLLPWPIAYAADISGSEETIRIEIAEDSVKPSFTAFGKAIGGVPPGDLFYIDATNNTADIVTTIYLNNAQDLIGHYTFLILKVGVYVENDGNWEKAYGSNGELISEIVLSMRNGQVSFLLPGYANYKVTIDGGSFYCHNASGDDSTLSPQLYLEVN